MSSALSRAMPVLRGTIVRRILVNYRVDADVAAGLLPSPFRPQLYAGRAIAGVCLIRLARVRPTGLPGWVSLGFENAAVRIAAERDTPAGVRSGVFVLGRYTGSRLAAFAGGRLFPGVHRQARVASREAAGEVAVSVRAEDGFAIAVRGRCTDTWPGDSIFASGEVASAFFAAGSVGYSWHPQRREFECLELCVPAWKASPFAIGELAVSFFDDPLRFPRGTIAFDHALAMRDIAHEWRVRAPIAAVEVGAVHSPLCEPANTPIKV